MKKVWLRMICLTLSISLLFPLTALAREGDRGFEGGISGEIKAGEFNYQEVCFISGEPVVFKGTLQMKKTLKQDSATKQEVITTTYTYRNLVNTDKSAVLTRSNAVYTTRRTKKDNGQIIEETSVGTGTTSSKFTETIKIGSDTYTLTNYDFKRTNIIDSKATVDYYAGNVGSTKIYQKGTGTDAGTVKVETTGTINGYNQYWSSTQVENLKQFISWKEKKEDVTDEWGGEADIALSSTSAKRVRYVENEIQPSPFEGGFVQTQTQDSIMVYNARLPEMDEKGVSTDHFLSYRDSLQVEAFPTDTRLPVANLSHIRGHWAENDIKVLFGLEIFKGNGVLFDPEKYMTRAEFTSAVILAAREVPSDPLLQSRSVTGRTSREKITSPFVDVPTDDAYFESINSAYKRGLIGGNGTSSYGPNENLTLADALTIFIRALGLESMASSGGAVTTFKDNDDIPDYARSAVYVAEKVGLVKGDDRGYLNPKNSMTNAQAAALINRFVGYMREGMKNDYREQAINY